MQSGVQRLVLLSGRGDEEALLSEQALQNSGADWTILRPSWFCQNFSEDFLLDGERSIDMFLRSCGDLPMSEKETTRKAVGRRPEHLSVFERFRRWSEAASASYKSPRTRCAVEVDIRDRNPFLECSQKVREKRRNTSIMRIGQTRNHVIIFDVSINYSDQWRAGGYKRHLRLRDGTEGV